MSNTKNMKNNKLLINIFSELYQIHSTLENTYEALSYKKIVDSLKKYDKPIKSSYALKNRPGFGDRTLKKVDEILTTGKLTLLEDLKKDKKIMARVEFQKILGVGPKLSKDWVLHKKIYSISELKKAVKSGNIQLTDMQKIGLKYFKDINKPITRKEIKKFEKDLKKTFKKNKNFKNLKVIIAGSYRRGKLISGDIDIIIVDPKIKSRYQLEKVYTDRMKQIIHYLKKEKIIKEIITISTNSSMVINKYNQKTDIKISPTNLLPFYLLYFSSGETFARKIRQDAKDRGYKLTQWGIFEGNRVIMNKADSEDEIFHKLGLIPVNVKNR